MISQEKKRGKAAGMTERGGRNDEEIATSAKGRLAMTRDWMPVWGHDPDLMGLNRVMSPHARYPIPGS